MKKRKLIGANNITVRENTFMDCTVVELHGYENIYAIDTNGVLTTLIERIIGNKIYDKEEINKDPYKLSFQFVENGEWEEYK